MNSAELDDYRWLVGSGRPWLAEASQTADSLTVRAARLRRSLPANRVHLLLEQVELRGRGRAKFRRAAEMFFTRKGLEQATDEAVAGYKAGRFPAGREVADLCCGIGGDLLALARRGVAWGVDRDSVAALLARANLDTIVGEEGGGERAAVVLGDALHWPIRVGIAWHIDPDRRPKGRRTTRVDLYDPPVDELRRLLRGGPHAAIKLAPAAEPPWEWAEAAELEWISRDRQCRQLVAWFGDAAQHPGCRRATRVRIADHDGYLPSVATLFSTRTSRPTVAETLGRYVIDPDPAVLAAGLLGPLAERCGLEAAGQRGGYLTGDRRTDDPLADCFEVLEAMPLDVKRLRRWLAERGIGRLEIKKRAVDCDVESLRRRLALYGDEEAVLIVAPLAVGVAAIVARRLRSEG